MRRFTTDFTQWITSGDIKYAVNIVDGLENAPEAFVGMLRGENIGKQVVKIAAKL